MTSLNTCLAKLGKNISAADAELLKSIAQDYVADGMSASKAAKAAIMDVVDLVMDERAELTQVIESKGGLVPEYEYAGATKEPEGGKDERTASEPEDKPDGKPPVSEDTGGEDLKPGATPEPEPKPEPEPEPEPSEPTEEPAKPEINARGELDKIVSSIYRSTSTDEVLIGQVIEGSTDDQLKAAIVDASMQSYADQIEVLQNSGSQDDLLDALGNLENEDAQLLEKQFDEEYTNAVLRSLKRRARDQLREQKAEEFREKIQEWIKESYAQLYENDPNGLNTDIYNAFIKGFYHHIHGGSKSNLPRTGDSGAILNGYKSAVKWIKTKDGQDFKRGIKVKKIKSTTDTPLRRVQDMMKEFAGDELAVRAKVRKILTMTARNSVIDTKDVLNEQSTPGAERVLWEMRNYMSHFKKTFLQGATSFRLPYKMKIDEAVMEWVFVGPTRGEGEKGIVYDDAGKIKATPQLKELEKAALEYMEIMEKFRKALSGERFGNEQRPANITELVENLRKYDSETTTDETWPFDELHEVSTTGKLKTLRLYADINDEKIQTHLEKEHQGQQRRKPLIRPALDDAARHGFEDKRKGKNITGEEVKETFGFAEVILGNAATGTVRQAHLNFAYDAFWSLAETLKIDPKHIGMGGKLWFAVGALGSGKASAHFQQFHPVSEEAMRIIGAEVTRIIKADVRGAVTNAEAFKLAMQKYRDEHGEAGLHPVINLTATRGDGALAHEWFHALDFLSEPRGDPKEVAASTGRDGYRGPLSGPFRQLVTHLTYPIMGEKEIASTIRASADGWQHPAEKLTDDDVQADKLLAQLEDAIGMWNNAAGRPNVSWAWPTIGRSNYKTQADRLGEDYWGNSAELIARSGEAWVWDSMHGQTEDTQGADFNDDYLVSNWVEDGVAVPPEYRGTPYPRDLERQYFSERWRDLISNYLEFTDKGVFWKEITPSPDGASPLDYDGTVQARIKFLEEWADSIRGKAEKAKEERRKKEEEEKEKEQQAKREKEEERKKRRDELRKKLKDMDTGGEDLTQEGDEDWGDLDLDALLDESIDEISEEADHPGPDVDAPISTDPDTDKMPGSKFSQPNQGALTLSSEAFLEAILRGEGPKNNRELLKMHSQYGDENLKNAQEAYEAALVSSVRDIVSESSNDRDTYDALVEIYKKQPNLSARTSTSMSNQAYSTPAPLAFLASRLAKVSDQGMVYEPTAGNGMLLIGSNAKMSFAGEVDERRADNLRRLGFRVLVRDATTVPGQYLEYDSMDHVLVNPPFGASYDANIDGYTLSKIEHIISARALQAMKPEGRATLIISAQREAGEDFTSSNRTFYNWLYEHYHVVSRFEVDGSLYSRQGASWPVTIISIAGRKYTEGAIAPVEAAERVSTWEELFDEYEKAQTDNDVVSDGSSGRPRGLAHVSEGTVGETGDDGRAPRGDEKETGTDVGGDRDKGRTKRSTGKLRGRPAAGDRTGDADTGDGGPDVGRDGGAGPDDAARTKKGQRKAKGDDRGTDDRAGGTAGPETSIKEDLKGAVKASVEGAEESFKALAELFGVGESSSGVLRSFPGIRVDAETYAKAKPHFEAAWQKYKEAGKRGGWALKKIIKLFNKDALAFTGTGGKPYILRFLKEKEREERTARGDVLQVPYPTMSEGYNEFVLTPSNMADQQRQALESLTGKVGNLDDYVAKKLKFSSKQAMWSGQDKIEGLMALQVDAVAASIYEVENGGGLIIADQTGIGKGRQAAAIIRYAIESGKIPIFMSAKPDLFTDMYGDYNDLGEVQTELKPFIFNGMGSGGYVVAKDYKSGKTQKKFGLPTKKKQELISEISDSLPKGYNALFTTYSQLNNPASPSYQARMAAIKNLAPNAVFILDESHNAAGTDSNINQYMMDVLGASKNGVIYLSATYAKRPDNTPIYFRTALSDAFDDVESMIDAMDRGGVRLQSVISSSLSGSGQLFRRERSFDGIDVNTKFDTKNEEEHTEIMDTATSGMRAIIRADDVFKDKGMPAVDKWLREQGHGVHTKNGIRVQLKHTSFFSQIFNAIAQVTLGIKAKSAADEAIAALERGEKPVIGLYNTMEGFIDKYIEETNSDDFTDVTFKHVLLRNLDKVRDVTFTHRMGHRDKIRVPMEVLPSAVQSALRIAEKEIEALDIPVPVSPIDKIKQYIQDAGYTTAEITGRTKGLDYSNPTSIKAYTRTAAEQDRVAIRDQFNNGGLDTIILNVAGATGISLHASQKYKDTRQRHMIIAQPMLDISMFVQIMGRINRTGQVTTKPDGEVERENASYGLPYYTLLNLAVPSETRPTAVLMGKLKLLNANVSSNSKGAVSFEAPDMMNKYGDEIGKEYLAGAEPEMQRLLRLGSDSGFMRTVTGRMAVLPTETQKKFYAELTPLYNDHIEYLDRIGQNDLKVDVVDLQAEALDQPELLFKGSRSGTIFGEDAEHATYTVKKQGKPPTGQEVQKHIDKVLHDGELTSKDYMEVQVLDSKLEKKQQWIEGMKSQKEELDKRLVAEDFEDIHEQTNIQARITRLSNLINDADQVELNFKNALNLFQVGQSYVIDMDIGGENPIRVKGTLAEVQDKAPTNAGNPYAFSKTKLVFMMASNESILPIPMSKVSAEWDHMERLNEGKRKPIHLVTKSDETYEEIYDSPELQRATEEREIITGNLLLALQNIPALRSKDLVYFTKADGTTATGLVLPKGFDLADETLKDVQLTRPDEILALFEEFGSVYAIRNYGVASRNGRVRLIPRQSGNESFSITVPYKKQNGEVFYQDQELLSLVQDQTNGFIKVGDSMIAVVSHENAVPALERILQMTGIYAPESIASYAKQITERGQDVGPEISEYRDTGATRFVTHKHGSKEVRLSLLRYLGPKGYKSLVDSDFVEIYDSIEKIPQEFLPIGEVDKRLSGTGDGGSRIHAWYDHKRARVVMIANRIALQNVRGVFIHELGVHLGMEPVLGTAQFQDVMRQARRLLQEKDPLAVEAWKRIPKLGSKLLYKDANTDALLAEELVAYMAQLHQDAKTGGATQFIKDIVARIRAWLFRQGVVKKLTAADISAMAEGFAARANNIRKRANYGRRTPATQKDFRFADETTEQSPEAERGVEGAVRGLSEDREVQEQPKKWAEKVHDRMNKAFAWYNEIGNLPLRDLYMEKRYLALGKIAEWEGVGNDFYSVFKKGTAEQKAQVYHYLTTSGADPSFITEESMRETAVAAKAKIDKIGRMLVKRGLLSQEAYEEHQDAYLPRIYLKHLLEPADRRALGSGKKTSDFGYLKERKDIPVEIRHAILGEITDPGFLVHTGVVRAGRDIAIIDFLEEISQRDEWVYVPSIITFQEDVNVESFQDPDEGVTAFKAGSKISAFALHEEIERIKKQIPYYTPEVKRRAQDVLEQLEKILEPHFDGISRAPSNYKQVPMNLRYGTLRGLWVRKEIHDDIMGAGVIVDSDPSIAEKLLGYGGWGTKLTQIWKMMKVPFNPPTQFRNLISNLILLNLSGVPIRRIPRLLRISLEQYIKKEGKYYDIAKKYGITQTTFAAQELYRVREELLDLEKRMKGKPFSMEAFKHIAGIISRGASGWYQFSETWVKTAKIIHEMEHNGKSEAEAALDAQKWLYDYSMVPRSVQYLRNAPVGVPFVTFYYKTLPRMLEVLFTAPWRFAPYLALPYLLAQYTASAFDVDDDDVEALRKTLPEWMRKHGHAMLLPVKDRNGRWVPLDVGFYFPWNMYSTAVKQGVSGELGEMVKTIGVFGGPIPSIITAIQTNTDSFTGRQIANPADPPETQVKDIMTFVYGMAMPGWLTDRGVAGKLYDAIATDNINRYGDPKLTIPQATARFFGVNVYPFDPVEQRKRNIRRMEFEIQEIKSRRTRVRKDRSLSEDEKRAQLQRYREIINGRRAELRKYRRESYVHPNLR